LAINPWFISVANGPGLIATTVIPSPANSCASARVTPEVPPCSPNTPCGLQRHMAHHRRQIDNAPIASPLHHRNKRPRDQKHRRQIRIEHRVPLVQRVLDHRFADVHPGVVDQDVDAPESLPDCVLQRAHLFSSVTSARTLPHPRRIRCRLVQLALSRPTSASFGAGGAQFNRHRPSQPAARASNYGDTPIPMVLCSSI